MRPLVIGIELIDDPAWMGGTLYLRNLATALLRLPEGERPAVQLLGAPAAIERFGRETGTDPARRPPAQSRWSRLFSRWGLHRPASAAVDVVYPGFGAPVPGAVTIRWIPDFQHRYLPELFSAEERAARDLSIGAIAAQSGVVVLSSAVAAEDFRRFYPDARATPRVWRFCSLLDTSGAPPPLPPELARRLPEKFLYLPNQFWAHKNHLTVFKALARLRAEQQLRIPLVCTGAQSDRRNAAHFDSLMRFIDEHDLGEQVHLLGLIDRNDQVGVLRRAAAVVQPSRFEGWSTVVEDVRATGRPLFLSDLPVHREQAPERCTYFPPESDAALAAALGSRWAALAAGPDPAAEAAARAAVQDRIQASAREFCDIARAALRIARG
jgi:glycosyltransferase involved in cell wall biosynthesis